MDLAAVIAAIRARALYIRLVLAVVVVCCLMVGFDTWRTLEQRTQTIEADKVETTNLARSLAQHAHDVVQSVDTAIVSLREVAELEGVNARTFSRLDALMATQTAALPVLHAIVVFDATGRYVADSLPVHQPSLNGSDRPYFKFHAANPDRGVRLGQPVRSKIDGSWILTVSRRIDAPDGGFEGVVVGTISIDVIQSFYATFDVGHEGSITLMSSDGILVARKPADEAKIGTSLAQGQFFLAAKQDSSARSFQYVSQIDGTTRLGSYQRIDGFPLLILVSHGLDEILVGWHRTALFHLIVVSGIALCFAAIGLFLFRQVRRRLALEAALRLNEQQYRLLAENSTDVVIQLGADLHRTYVSPTGQVLLGYGPGELVGRPYKDLVHGDDWPAVCASLSDAGPDGIVKPINHRVRMWGGAYLWVETAGRKLSTDDGYVLNLRDITRRRETDALLQASNEQLQRLVMTDALTNVGNRQGFDTALTREYPRVERSDKALSLLFIDLDHFALLNDRFGPIAGDRCLRLVATAIQGCISRSSDLVARTGDDEFAVLLPEANGQEAALMAEAICEAARKLNASVISSSAAGAVTVSVGVATVFPRSQPIGPQNLVYMADEALAAAKSAGRDRWHVSSKVAEFLPTIVIPAAEPEAQPAHNIEPAAL